LKNIREKTPVLFALWSLTRWESKIAVGTEVPENTPVTSVVVIVDFHDPVHIAHRKNKVAIIRGVNKSIPVGSISPDAVSLHLQKLSGT
jgi:hypothetical protein